MNWFFVRSVVVLAGCMFSAKLGVADSIEYHDEEGNKVSIEAQMIGDGQGFQVFERRDGQLQIVPNAAVVSREPADPPKPFDEDQMVEMLTERFGADLIRTKSDRGTVVGLILESELPESAESHANGFIKKASSFMAKVDSTFLKYAKSRRFPLKEPRFPLVLLIFESDDEFNKYTDEATGGRGLSAENILGFYSPITNWLAVRMGACDTFEVPLHEAIHLHMYNRVFNRLAPIPKWFDEGIATGFEGSGDRISISPAKINSNYARRAAGLTGRVDWESVISNDGAFTADVLAGEAYTLAWCMHWMLTTRHQDEYQKYVEELSTRETLEVLDSDERVERFEEAFSLTIDELQSNFPQALRLAARSQKVRLQAPRRDGTADRTQAMGQVEMKAVESSRGVGIEAAGTLTNLSPLRTMTFYVTMETSGGTYAEWLVPNVRPGRREQLRRRQAVRRFPIRESLPAGTFQIFVRSAPSDSEESHSWQSGNVPGPKLAR